MTTSNKPTASNKPVSNTGADQQAPAAGKQKKIIVGVVIGLAVVAAALFAIPKIFGGDSKEAEVNPPAANATETPEPTPTETAPEYNLVKPGVLTVATEGTYRPFSYHEDGSGELVGYDVEIAKAVAAKLGLEIEFQETQWDAIFAGLEAGRFDVIANQVSINPDRQAKYLLSTPYTISPGVLIVSESNTDINSLTDLVGKTNAQSLTSNWYTLAESYGAKIEAVEGWAQAVALLEQGRVDATFNDRLTFLDYQQLNGATGIKVVAETDDPSRNAFALKQGNDKLLDDINTALAELQADGTLAAIGEKYFGADVSK